MHPLRKFWLVLIGVVLAMVVIACSCGSIIPTPTASPRPTATLGQTNTSEPTNKPEPTNAPEPTNTPEPPPSAVGRWEDPDSNAPYSITTIEEQNGQYVVVSITNSGRGDANELTFSKYVNGVLTWEYCPNGMHCITSEFVSVTSNNLTATWYWSDSGNGGTTTYRRAP